MPAWSGFDWCCCPKPKCKMCGSNTTDALAITIAGIGHQSGGLCDACTEFNGTWIVPFWPESVVSPKDKVCDFRLPLDGIAGQCGYPVDLMARLFANPDNGSCSIEVHLRYFPFPQFYPPTHAAQGSTVFDWRESSALPPNELTPTEVCNVFDQGFSFETPAINSPGYCIVSGATCYIEGTSL